jgi:hypothetical protein
VVVETLYAVVARCAMNGTWRTKDSASITVSQADDETIDDLLLFLLDGKCRSLGVAGAAGDDARVTTSSCPKRRDGDQVYKDAD